MQVGVSETISHLAQANIKLAVDLQAATAEKEALKNKADTMARQLAAAQVVWDVRVPSKLKLNLCFQADRTRIRTKIWLCGPRVWLPLQPPLSSSSQLVCKWGGEGRRVEGGSWGQARLCWPSFRNSSSSKADAPICTWLKKNNALPSDSRRCSAGACGSALLSSRWRMRLRGLRIQSMLIRLG